MAIMFAYLKHIGNDKQVGKRPPLCSNCKQSNDPSEAHERNKDDSGLDQTPVHGHMHMVGSVSSKQCMEEKCTHKSLIHSSAAKYIVIDPWL